MNTRKLAVILLITGTALLIPTVLLAVYVDSPVSTVLLALSVILNAVAVNILILGAQRRRRERRMKNERGNNRECH